MLGRLIYLNWTRFLSRLTNFQTVLVVGYIIFLLVLFSNLLGSALVIILLDKQPGIGAQLPWLTPRIHHLILLIFSNIFWLLHFSFTSTRLLNLRENRKLLAYGYPASKLAWHLNLMGFFHPLNIVYNLTWVVFLLVQIQHFMYIPVVLAAVLLNYGIIYSFKHRFLKIIEKRFKLVVFSLAFILLGILQVLAILFRNPGLILAHYLPGLDNSIAILTYLPGGLLLSTATANYNLPVAAAVYAFSTILVFLIFRDHYYKTREGLLSPLRSEARRAKGKLWSTLRRWFGRNAGKFYYYILIHPYNRLFVLTLVLIPTIYIPLLLHLEESYFTAILIPTMLAAIPVALLAIGMANMFGYENREFLLHMQFPEPFEKQLKERFLGIITVPLFIFYLITFGEIIYLPQLGEVYEIYIANTFFFLCFMLIFMWTSFNHFKRASYSSFSFKHPIIPQKVTFLMTFLMFGLGYATFAPLGQWQVYRIWVMCGLIVAISVYLWQNMDMLVGAFNHKILSRLWNTL